MERAEVGRGRTNRKHGRDLAQRICLFTFPESFMAAGSAGRLDCNRARSRRRRRAYATQSLADECLLLDQTKQPREHVESRPIG